MIQNPTEIKKVKSALQEISDSMTRIASERDLIKDIIDMVSEEHELEKKSVRMLAKVYHSQSFATVTAESEEFEILYETLFRPSEDVN